MYWADTIIQQVIGNFIAEYGVDWSFSNRWNITENKTKLFFICFYMIAFGTGRLYVVPEMVLFITPKIGVEWHVCIKPFQKQLINMEKLYPTLPYDI